LTKWLENWKETAEELEKQVFALYLAFRHPRTPWYAKALALAVTAHTLSPIDLIPDFIPVLGYLDDLVIVPLGIFLVMKMVPPEVMAECRNRAAEMQAEGALQFRWMGPVVVFLWLVALAVVVTVVVKILQR
jgi:uncharacterized membrane protein YkvA (DUF1232 family)